MGANIVVRTDRGNSHNIGVNIDMHESSALRAFLFAIVTEASILAMSMRMI